MADTARSELANFAVTSDQETANLATRIFGRCVLRRAADHDHFHEPVDHRATANRHLSLSIDLINDSIRAVASPGPERRRPRSAFAVARGVFDSFLEASTSCRLRRAARTIEP